MSSQRLPSQRLLDADVPEGTQLSGTRRTVLPWLLVAVLSAATGAMVVDRFRASGENTPVSVPTTDDGTVPAMPGVTRQRGARRTLDATTDRDGSLNVLGVVEPAWPMPLTVAARVDARVVEVLIQPGDALVPGRSPVVRLDSTLLTTAVREAAARVEVAQNELAAAEAERNGTSLSRLNEAVRQAEQNRNLLSEQYQAARVVSPDAVSPEALREIRNQLDLAEKRVDDARAAVDQLLQRLERELRLAYERLDSAEAAKERTTWQLSCLDVVAPAAPGSESLAVLEVLVHPGDVVTAGTVLAHVYDPRQLQVRALVPAREVSRIVLGQPRRAPVAPATPPADTNAPASNTGERVSPAQPSESAAATFSGGTPCTVRPSSGNREDERDAVPVRFLPTADAELDAVTLLVRITPDNRTPLRPGSPVRLTIRTTGR